MLFTGTIVTPASLDKLQAMNSACAVVEFAPDGTITSANRNFLDMLGYTAEEIRGRHHRVLVAPETAESLNYQAFWQQLSRGEAKAAEVTRVAKGGREIWMETFCNPILDRRGRLYKIIEFATDVTSTKAEIAGYVGQVTAINKSLAVIEFKLDGTILRANQNFLRAVGYTLAEIEGRHHSMFVDPTYAASAEYYSFWTKLADGEYLAGRFQRIGKGGRKVWLQASYNPIFDLHGMPLKVVKYASDVTEHMTLLGNLKTLIDRNFAQLDAAVEQSASCKDAVLQSMY